MPINVKTFRDIDLDFGRHPVTNDVNVVTNDVAVKRSIRNLIQYNLYEKPGDPLFGGNLRGVLGEPSSIFTDSVLRDKIIEMINTEERRAQLRDVEIVNSPDQNGLWVTITFTVVNIPNLLSIEVFLDKLR